MAPKENNTIQMMNIVSAKWWRKWTDYTSFESHIGLKIFKNDLMENNDRIACISFEEETSMISSHQKIVEELRSKKKSESPRSYFVLNDVPPPIDNSAIIDKKTAVLKQGLLEHFDYETIHPNIYAHLAVWYGTKGGVPGVVRPVIIEDDQLEVDLYQQEQRDYFMQ
jgi:hypothetical protein